MPRIEKCQIHPSGWQTDPETERFKLSTFDFLSTTTFTSNGTFFRVADERKVEVAALLKKGLELTLSQVRHYVGTIEVDEDGGFSIIKKRGSTVTFAIQHLDGPNDAFPSFHEIAQAHYLSPILGDTAQLSDASMLRGNRPEAQPQNSPRICSFKVNFIPGGIIFVDHMHHWANGLTGSTAFYKQLAANCYALFHATPTPTFNPKWLHRDLYGLPGFDRHLVSNNDPGLQAPPQARENMQHKPSSSVVFHLRKSKGARLKNDVSAREGVRISTYDAMCALMWRILSKLREPLYKPGLDYKPLWGQGVSFSRLFTDPALPEQLQGNLQFDITSRTSPVPELTLAEIISETPLSQLALYTRQMTSSVTVDMLFERIKQFQRVKNPQDLSILVDSFPPMSLLMADWRSADRCNMDFGFGQPSAWRHFFGGVPLCLAVVIPPREGPAGDDEGLELQFALETDLIPQLLQDPDWSRYFEYRGIDASEEITSDAKSKL